MISRALSALGLMRISEYEDIASMTDAMVGVLAGERDEALERFKLAATDLAKQAEEIEALRFSLSFACSSADRDDDTIIGLQAEITSLRPDAQKWRASLKRSRDRKSARKGSVS